MRKDTPEYVKEIAKELRRNQTEAEEKLWKCLRGNGMNGYKFRRQYCFGRYIADFYCSSARLVIEIDGKIHMRNDRAEYDKIREKELYQREIRILRINNDEVLNDLDTVLNTIHKALME